MKRFATIALIVLASYGADVSTYQNKDVMKDTDTMYDRYGNKIGTVDTRGEIKDNEGNKIGSILKDGTVIDKNGNTIMQIRKTK